MGVWHKTLSSRFQNFPQHQQLLMVANELNRSHNMLDNVQEYKFSLERAMELLDFLCSDTRWLSALRELRRAREVIAGYYISSKPIDTASLQKCLILLNVSAWEMVNGVKTNA